MKSETIEETVIINESNLPNGFYWLIARNHNGTVIKKLNVLK